MTFIEDAKTQFLKLWSVRFSLMLAVFGAIQTGMAVYDGESIIAPIITALAGIAIAVSRVIAQPALKASNGWEATDGSSTH